MLSSPLGDGSCAPLDIGEHGAQHHIGEMTLQAAQGLEPGLALGGSSRHVCLRARVGPGLDERDRVEGPIELSVAASVEAVSAGLAGGAGMGAVPLIAANAGVERMRRGSPVSPRSLAAVMAATPVISVVGPRSASR